MTKKIFFTGGGSSGHVTPNLALIEHFSAEWDVAYVGSPDGIEQEIISRLDIPYHSITCDKLRRYLTWRHFFVPFRVLKGIWESYLLFRRHRPDILFSKGGFVAFPAAMGAWLNRIPVITHESDRSPGLANRLSFFFCRHICVTFPEKNLEEKYQERLVVTGAPIRQDFFQASPEKGREFCQFSSEKPTLLLFGGGLGSKILNETLWSCLEKILTRYQVIHICGKGKSNPDLKALGYKQLEYVNDEFPDLLACADIVISRAGANSIYELLILKKPHILVPLSRKASRGDQEENAQYFKEQGVSAVILEEEFSPETLLTTIGEMEKNLSSIRQKLEEYNVDNGVRKIEEIIQHCIS